MSNLKPNQDNEYYYSNRNNVIEYARQVTTELMNLYDTYNKLTDMNLISETTPIFTCWEFFNMYLIDFLSLPQNYKVTTESKIIDCIMPNNQNKRIPFYKYLFQATNYLCTFKDMQKNVSSIVEFLNELNEYSININKCIFNVKDVFQDHIPYLKLFKINNNEIHLYTPS